MARPWDRKFLAYTETVNRIPRLRVSLKAVERLKEKLRPYWERGSGCSLPKVAKELAPVLRGWVANLRLAEVMTTFETLDAWIRRELRCV